MIPGKQYKPEDFIRAAWRRRWVIVVPLALAAAVTAVWARKQPNSYRSQTTLIIVPPSGVGELASRKAVTPIESRLYTLRQQVMSHDHLMGLITGANLYSDWRAVHPQGDPTALMQQDISIDIVKGNPKRIDETSFTISYTSGNPQTAAMVTKRLANLIVSENTTDRKEAAQRAIAFLDVQLADARTKLEAQESKVEAYRQRYGAELPSMQQSNLEAIRRAEAQLENLESSLSTVRAQRLALESRIAAAKAPINADAASDQGGSAIGDQLDAARKQLKTLELALTREHPDVIRQQRKVTELEERARAEGVPQGADGVILLPAEVARRQRLQDLQAQLTSLNQQISDKEQAEPKIRAAIATYQERVDAAPARETELSVLTRDQVTLEGVYEKLLSDRENSRIATNLEAAQTDRFKVVEPAQVPQTPFSPNRAEWILLGAFFGLGVGIGLAALLEYPDSSLRTDSDVLDALDLPVLAMIPVMRTSSEVSGRRLQRAAISALVVMLMGSAIALALNFRL